MSNRAAAAEKAPVISRRQLALRAAATLARGDAIAALEQLAPGLTPGGDPGPDIVRVLQGIARALEEEDPATAIHCLRLVVAAPVQTGRAVTAFRLLTLLLKANDRTGIGKLAEDISSNGRLSQRAGRLLLEHGLYEQALTVLEQDEEAAGRNASTLRMIAVAKQQLGQLESAFTMTEPPAEGRPPLVQVRDEPHDIRVNGEITHRVESGFNQWHFRNGYVLNARGVIADSSKSIQNWLLPANYKNCVQPTPAVNIDPDGSPIYVIASFFHFNFFHWLIQTAPVIEWLVAAHDRPRIAIVNSPAKFVEDTLQLFGDRARFETIEAGAIARQFGEVVVIEPHNIVHGDALRRFARRLAAAAKPTGHQRVFISRADAPSKRPLLNREDLERFLREHGFEVVTLSGLDLSTQAGLLKDAKIIVAEHGAGLSNAIVASAGTQVLELIPPDFSKNVGFRHRSFVYATNFCQQHYFRFLGTRFNLVPATESPFDTLSWRIDIEQVERFMKDKGMIR
ncbi:hypothetical protein ASF00_07490 [Sphingomonas sp. Leaf34]|uniref:glycosyltransferase 61 family protein n=1 Tax=Sphingomonas sp. Leaf34 TaxID=1736216 RepID=UPI000701E7B0|nr:glycosyltransferase 61 family protein [Sphingomonas sp. Leaf34]KQN30555.1 hypothetical protein ASF00_07490 [Sphingomonas sp. Leaf34]